MKKIYIIYIAAMLMFTGCKSSSDKETEGSSDISVFTVTKETEIYSKENSTAKGSIQEKSEAETSTEEITSESNKEKYLSESVESDKTISEIQTDDENFYELPIISNDIQEFKAEVTTYLQEKSEIRTTASDTLSETTTCIKDDVIELPFVPVE